MESPIDEDVPVVAVFLSGRPLWGNPELHASTAFVAAWRPGSEGAAVADVPFRDRAGAIAFDFQGTLSCSWPRTPDEATVNWNGPDCDPVFPSGFGLTYAGEDTLPDTFPEN